MSKKLSEIFFQRTFEEDENQAVYLEDVVTYGKIIEIESYSEERHLDVKEKKFLQEIAIREGITDYKI